MNKCGFCAYFDPITGCYWDCYSLRRDECEEAIERMEKALASIGTVTNIISSGEPFMRPPARVH